MIRTMATSLVGAFMVLMAVGIAGMWTIDIVRSPELDRTRGLLRTRDRAGSVMLPHWIAEYTTAAALLIGGAGLVMGWQAAAWAWLVPAALGALAYTSVNSLGWVLADRARLGYGAPMVIGAGGAVVSLLLLVAGAVLPAPA